MLLDRTDWTFSAQDLHNEWQNKSTLFKTILADFGEKVAPLKWLLQLVEHIGASDMSYRLFPGEKIDRLHISNTVKGKINHDIVLKIEFHVTDRSQVNLILYKREKRERGLIVDWSCSCHPSYLIAVFDDFMQQNPSFLNIDGSLAQV
jgi:hypothetical protein